MAWVKIDEKQLVNLEKVTRVIKSDTLLQTTNYQYSISYDYKDCDARLVVYEQKFTDAASRDRFFDIVEAALQPIKDDRK